MTITLQGSMTEQSGNWSQERRIPSEATAGKEVIDELLVHLTEQSWDENDVFGVHLAVEEAVVNAIKHGNQNDRSKTVHVAYSASPKSLRIEITDEGDGFNPGDVPDPTDDDHLEMPSGRGLMLMRSFMSSVIFNDRGNSVVMEKQL